MKKYRFLAFGLICFLLFPFAQNTAMADFSDTQGNAYMPSIQALQELGVMQGYVDGTFKPQNKVNRAEFLKTVLTALDPDMDQDEFDCFPDVQREWFAPYVCKAKEMGIVQGYPDGLYHPEKEVNMVEAFKIAIDAFGLDHEEPLEGEEWYETYVEFAHVNNVFSKYAYFPNAATQRDETAFIIYKILKIFSGVDELSSVRNAKSSGCGLEPPYAAPSTFTLNGVKRSAIVVIPENYDRNQPLPLLFAFHGRTNANTQVRNYYRFEKVAANEAIFVYPAGLKSGASFTWSDAGDSADSLRDYEFFDMMYEEITNLYCVNVDEVYAAGHSLGAWFVNSLACARGDLLRGVTTLAGSRSSGSCSGPVSVMQWHNPKDNLTSFSSGLFARDEFIKQNQCSSSNVAVEPAWGNCVEYQSCLSETRVLWCPHNIDNDEYSGEYYPHTWPRDAGEEMWNFLRGV